MFFIIRVIIGLENWESIGRGGGGGVNVLVLCGVSGILLLEKNW